MNLRRVWPVKNCLIAVHFSIYLIGVIEPVMATQGDAPGAASPTGDAQTVALKFTGVPTDLAVDGPGFIILTDPATRETLFTRSGRFHVDAEGFLVSAQGFRLQGFNTSIRFGRGYSSSSPVGDLKLDEGALPAGLPATAARAYVSELFFEFDGRILVVLSDGSAYIRGQVLLENVSNLHSLTRRWLYFYSDAQGVVKPQPPSQGGLGRLVSGALEASTPEARGYAPSLFLDRIGERTEIWVTPASELTFVEASSDLIDWTSIRTNSSGGSSLRFYDADASGTQVRFYRVASPLFIKQTGSATDLAISGLGFFIVKDPKTSAQFATRAGNFRVDAKNFLVTAGGLRVQGYNSPIPSNQEYLDGSSIGDIQLNRGDPPSNLPSSAKTAGISTLSIGTGGKISVLLSDGSQYTRGQILLQKLSNPFALAKEPGGLWSGIENAGPLPRPAKPLTQELGRINAGALELRL